MDIETAQKAFGFERTFIISLVLFLKGKGIIESAADMDLLRELCRSTLRGFKGKLQDPVADVQLGQTGAELEHFFDSFRLPVL